MKTFSFRNAVAHSLMFGPKRTKQGIENEFRCGFESVRPIVVGLFKAKLITYEPATGEFWGLGMRELVDLFRFEEVLSLDDVVARSGVDQKTIGGWIQLAVKNGYLAMTADNRYRVKMPGEMAVSPGK